LRKGWVKYFMTIVPALITSNHDKRKLRYSYNLSDFAIEKSWSTWSKNSE